MTDKHDRVHITEIGTWDADTDAAVKRITDRDFQLLRRRAWEEQLQTRVRWRVKWREVEPWVLWPTALVLGIAGLWEVLRW